METRRRIYEVITAFPGLHFRGIQRKTKLGNGSLKYNLSVLERRGVIESEKLGRTRRYYPRGFSQREKRLLGLLRLRTVRRILMYLLTRGEARHGDIARALELSPSTVTWHMKKLMEQGVVAERRGRYALADGEELRRALSTYRESLLDGMVEAFISMWEPLRR